MQALFYKTSYCYQSSYCILLIYSGMDSIIHSFKNYLYQIGYSAGMQSMLPACVREFLQHQQLDDISCIEQQKVLAFYEWLQVRPCKRRAGALSEMMISQYVYALKTFFTWAEVTGQLDYNPVSGMRFPAAHKQIREPLTITEVSALFGAAETLQETALLHLFYSCGLRRSETEALNSRDVHYTKQLLYVRAGKGAKRRVIPLTVKVTTGLEAYYLQERCSAAIQVKDADAFMLNKHGTRLRGDTCLKWLNRLVSRAGIPGAVSLHHLRHSIATHLLQGGMSIEYVRDFLGHEFLESTQIYAKPDAAQLSIL